MRCCTRSPWTIRAASWLSCRSAGARTEKLPVAEHAPGGERGGPRGQRDSAADAQLQSLLWGKRAGAMLPPRACCVDCGHVRQRDEDGREFHQQERIAAVYSQVKYMLDAKSNLLLGLRYEYWKRDFSNQDGVFEISKFFPSVLYTYAINQNSSINFNYSRRISRPAYTDLISNLFYTDPTFVFSGNPLLKPTLSDMLKVEYAKKV